MPNLVIGVGGRLTAGKDVFADHLVDAHGFVKLGMSDVLAEALYRLNPWIPLYTPKKPRKWLMALFSWLSRGDLGPGDVYTEFNRYRDLVDRVGYVDAKKNDEVRRLLQVLGTEVGRQLLGENIWVDAARRRITAELELGHDVVITGVRFPNELDLFHWWEDDDDVKATTVYVTRPGLPPAVHASETSVRGEDFEYGLVNDGTIEDLKTSSSELLDEIRGDYL